MIDQQPQGELHGVDPFNRVVAPDANREAKGARAWRSANDESGDWWQRCTKANPCPVCDGNKWCSIGKRVVHCMHKQSDRPASNGEGWLHPRPDVPPPPWRCAEKAEKPGIDWAADAPAIRHGRIREWGRS